jgi:hypothetical protein
MSSTIDRLRTSNDSCARSPHSRRTCAARRPGCRSDAATLLRGLNFTFVTSLGWIDLLGEIVGGGTWDDLTNHSVDMSLFGRPTRVLDLRRLIAVKRAAGRPKDLEAIAELEALLEERGD